MPEPARCISCGYVLWGLPTGNCPECGRWFDCDDPRTYSTYPPFVLWKYWLPGFLLSVGGGAVLYLLLLMVAGWGVAVSLVAPIAIGMAVGYGCRVKVGFNVLLCLAGIFVIVLTLWSMSIVGTFCGLVLAAVALIPALMGMAAGVVLRRRLKNSNFAQRWYLPFLSLAIVVMLVGVLERAFHKPYAIESVVTKVSIPAPAGRAWNAVMFYEQVRQRPPWLLRIGLPKPLYTTGGAANVGDTKTCVYSKGHLTKRITERVQDRRLAFDVIEQEHFENHSVRLTDGSFDFDPITPNQTSVALTTRYQPKLGPRWIWRPVERLAVHTMHRHVLEGMRQNAAAVQ